jgi:GNAT superfamily N-acetyltransferase
VSFVIERLSVDHDRAGFTCGEPALDGFIQRHARQNQAKDVSRTYVAVRRGERRVVGYYTLAGGSIEFERLPESLQRRLPHYAIPTILLARLAVDRSAQGEGLGELLLLGALRMAARIAESVGVFAVEVVAKNERAERFYRRYGFEPLPGNELNLYLTLATVRKLLEG